MKPTNINAAADGARGPGSKARAERAGTPHGQRTGQRRPYTGLVIMLCGAILALSAIAVGVAIQDWEDRKEFAGFQAAYEATKVTDAKIAEALAPKFGSPEVLVASFYGLAYHGRLTASGAHKQGPPEHWRFNRHALTAAHRTLPFGTLLRVERAGRFVDVVVTDRGPMDWTGRDLDLSEAAADALGMRLAGVARVLVRRQL